MNYFFKILAAIVITFFIGLSFYTFWLFKGIRQQYSIAIEDSLNDYAAILASVIEEQSQGDLNNILDFEEIFKSFQKKEINYKIYEFEKKNAEIDTYITNIDGIVIYDSRDKSRVGEDFSQFNDVYLTLQGKYGVRSSRVVQDDPTTSVFYIGAPLKINNKIFGVVSVIKKEQSIKQFIVSGRRKLVGFLVLSLLLCTVCALILSRYLNKPIFQLRNYAEKIKKGEDEIVPRTKFKEFDELGLAIKEMKDALEGKKKIEAFIQNLVHEIKSPLTAIEGAAEILEYEEDKTIITRLLGNIDRESKRARIVLDELLSLAKLESLSPYDLNERFSVRVLLDEPL